VAPDAAAVAGIVRKPPRLRPGDTVAIVAPANPWANRGDYLRSVEALERWGLKVKPGPHVDDRHGYMAGRDEDRAADVNAAFVDPDVRAVFALQGGYGSQRLVRHLDRDALAANPKLLCGFSDITILHLALQSWANSITLYSNGAMGVGAAEHEVPEFNKQHLHRALFSAEPFGEIPRNPDDPYIRTITRGVARGRLTGGCLTLVERTLGTPIEIDTRDRILFFEDLDINTYSIDSLLTHLRDAGKLEQAAGIVFGDTKGKQSGNTQELSTEDVLEEVLGPLGIPVIYGLPVGHEKHHATVPIGAEAILDADAGTLTVTEVITED
jgi:muramoyltetrapeptide carboxypeptidase